MFNCRSALVRKELTANEILKISLNLQAACDMMLTFKAKIALQNKNTSGKNLAWAKRQVRRASLKLNT